MAIPSRIELRLPFLNVLSDGEYHTHEEIAHILANDLGITDDIRQELLGASYQTALDNAINWLKGKELRVQWQLIEYNADKTALRITERGKKVLKAQFDGPLTYDVLRDILGEH